METGLSMQTPVDTQILADQTYQNRGKGGLVREAMEYGADGELLDAAPYPALYEYGLQQAHVFDHPERMRAVFQLARELLLAANKRMEAQMNSDPRVAEKRYAAGDWVRLSVEHYKLPVWTAAKCAKLRGRYFGPFRVAAVHSPVAIELELPSFMQGVHPVIHPQYLKLASNRRQERGLPALMRKTFEPADYDVEEILAHRKLSGSRVEYLVRWRDCSYLQSTWEPAANLDGAQSLVDAYRRRARQRELEPDAAAADTLLCGTTVDRALAHDPCRLGRRAGGGVCSTRWSEHGASEFDWASLAPVAGDVRVEQTGAARASAPAYGSAGGAPGPSGNAEPNGAVGGDLPRAAPLTRVPAPAPPLQTRSKSIIDLDPHGMECHVADELGQVAQGQ